jgi:hypothetical protein
MRPPPIYPQVPHLHNHGLAILACITPLWNMHPILKLFEKKFLKKWFSPQISSNPLSPQETELKKGRKKAPKLSWNKGEVNILRGERLFNFKSPFHCDPIFSPSIIPFQKPFPKSLRKIS